LFCLCYERLSSCNERVHVFRRLVSERKDEEISREKPGETRGSRAHAQSHPLRQRSVGRGWRNLRAGSLGETDKLIEGLVKSALLMAQVDHERKLQAVRAAEVKSKKAQRAGAVAENRKSR